MNLTIGHAGPFLAACPMYPGVPRDYVPSTGHGPLLLLTAKRSSASGEPMTRQALSDNDTSAARVAGVDGAAGGWVMAVTGAIDGSPAEFSLWDSFAELWAEAQRHSLLAVGVDMPIGLPSDAKRRADIDARKLLGRRRSSLFWPPPVAALAANDYVEANRTSREQLDMGLAKQAYNLLPKIREVRSVLTPADFEGTAVPQAAEVHPELCFAVMAAVPRSAAVPDSRGNQSSGGEESIPSAPLMHPKRRQAGIAERLALLRTCFAGITESAVLSPLAGPPHPGIDDLLDAAAAAWTARRIVAGQAAQLGAVDGCIEADIAGHPLTIVV